MNWKLISQLVTIVFIKLISTTLFLLYFSQIFQEVPKTTSQGGKGCSVRWVPFDSKCYYFSAVEKTWDESQEDCALSNSHLAVVNNNAELTFLLNRTENANYFIGLTHSGRWTWTDNSKFDPNMIHISYLKGFDCALVGFKTFGSQSCSVSSRWVCEENE